MDQSEELRSKFSLFLQCILVNFGALTSGIFFVGFNACFFEILKLKEPKPENENNFIASLTTAIPIGAIFGGFIACLLTIKLGRRSLMIVADLITIIGCIMSQSLQYSTMLAGRTICGFVCGMNFMLVPLYIRELLPYYMAPRTTVYFRGMFTLGTLLAFIFSLFSEGPNDTNDIWAIAFLAPIIFALIRLFGFVFWIKMDTATFYMKRDKKDKALESLKRIFKDQHWDDAYIRERNMSVSFRFREAFAPEYRTQVGTTLIVVLFTQLMGGNVLSFFSTKIILQDEETLFDVKILNVFIAIIALLTIIPSTTLTRRIGRRPLLVYGAILLCISSLLIAFSELISFAVAQRSLIVLFAFVQNVTYNTVSSVSAYEILPSYSLVFQVITEMCGAFLIGLIFPFLSIRINFLIFAVMSGIGFMVMFKIIKETKWISPLQRNNESLSVNQGFIIEDSRANEEPFLGKKKLKKEKKETNKRDDATADPISLY